MNYIKEQIAMSERLCKLMEADHNNRNADNFYYSEVIDSFIKKLDAAHQTISDLHQEIKQLKQKYEGLK